MEVQQKNDGAVNVEYQVFNFIFYHAGRAAEWGDFFHKIVHIAFYRKSIVLGVLCAYIKDNK